MIRKALKIYPILIVLLITWWIWIPASHFVWGLYVDGKAANERKQVYKTEATIVCSRLVATGYLAPENIALCPTDKKVLNNSLAKLIEDKSPYITGVINETIMEINSSDLIDLSLAEEISTAEGLARGHFEYTSLKSLPETDLKLFRLSNVYVDMRDAPCPPELGRFCFQGSTVDKETEEVGMSHGYFSNSLPIRLRDSKISLMNFEGDVSSFSLRNLCSEKACSGDIFYTLEPMNSVYQHHIHQVILDPISTSIVSRKLTYDLKLKEPETDRSIWVLKRINAVLNF